MQLMMKLQRYPQAYYTVYTPAIPKKGKGVQPLDHRMLAIFSGLYRIEAGAWFAMLRPWFQRILHPKVVGALAGMEALDVAWDAQRFLERAMQQGEAKCVVSYDYEKYFDSFDHDWTKQMLLHVGLPVHLAEMTHHLYTNMERVIKKGRTLSRPFSAYNGFGQGDVLSLLPALLLVSWQFKVVDKTHPLVQKAHM